MTEWQFDRTPTSRTGLKCASAWADITPKTPVPLAGYAERTQDWQSVQDSLEANAVLLDDDQTRVLFISADIIYFSAEIVAALTTRARSHGIDESSIFLTASHTHFAPATDPTKPMLGRVDSGYATFLRQSLLSLLDRVVSLPLTAVAVELCRRRTSLNINRRKRWPLPVLTRQGLSWGPNIVLAPEVQGPRDEYIDLLNVRDAAGDIVCAIWKFACHPVGLPSPLAISAEFPGRARETAEPSGGGRACRILAGFRR